MASRSRSPLARADAETRVPRYLQVASVLRRRISDGIWPVGSRIGGCRMGSENGQVVLDRLEFCNRLAELHALLGVTNGDLHDTGERTGDLALGGRPAAGFAKRLMLPVSKDTLLRVVRRRSRPLVDPPRVTGIDDWAWRRNHRYASIICNLERRRIVTLLPDREPATAQAWLAAHPTIAIIARDRGGGYGEAAAKALPNATQLADRWHIMENASRAFLDVVRKSMRQIRSVIGATIIDPKLLTAAERLQYEGYLRREETNAAILALAKDGVPLKQIARQTGHSRGMVRQVVRGERSDVFRLRQSSLELYLPWLDEQWVAGCRNGAELWRLLRARGFNGSLRVVTEWATRRRRAEKVDAENLQRIPSARTIARLMTIGRNRLSKAETVTIVAIEAGIPRENLGLRANPSTSTIQGFRLRRYRAIRDISNEKEC